MTIAFDALLYFVFERWQNLNRMTKLEEQHKAEVAKLNELEDVLINIIGIIADAELMEAFNKWQEKRNECNSLYNEWLAATLKSVGK